MPSLTISCLGAFQVSLDRQPLTGFTSNKVRALLAYLAVESESPHRRERLAGLLWPEQPEQHARGNLRQALTNLRHLLGDASPSFLLITRDDVRFNSDSDHLLDVRAFSAHLDACERHHHRRLAACQSCLQQLDAAAALYQGAFLEQFFLNDSPPFDEWALVERERFQHLALAALEQLASAYQERGDYKQARAYALRRVELAPWQEEAHRHLMQFHLLLGQRSTALSQYERCRRILAEELGVEPTPETNALYELIAGASDEEPGVVPQIHLARPTASRRHNLPPQPTPFIGREAELAEIARRLADPDCRLLTLVGPGGAGKTRLGLQAANEHIYAFPNGVWFVPLASLSSAAFLISAMADALAFTFSGREAPEAQLLDYLREKELLLILDNFEHLLEGTTLLVDILREAPGVQLLVTSRARLNLHGEWLVELAGLPYAAPSPQPSHVEWEDREEVERYPAVQLFLQSSRRLRVEFQGGRDEEHAVLRICSLVEGMPLAIELAAAWSRLLSYGEIATEIEGSLDFLATSQRDVEGRHRSLRAVFDHSWELLSVLEQSAFRKLSVFRGGFDREAAAQVAGATLPLLASLVDHSLLRRNLAGRYDLHELLRHYANERLVAAGEQEQTNACHLDYFLRLAEETERKLHGPEQTVWLDRLEAEHDNLRAALTWAIERDEVIPFARLAAALALFWKKRGYLPEARRWLDQALLLRQRVPADLEAYVLAHSGWVAYLQGDFALAKRHLERSIELWRETGNVSGLARSLVSLGSTIATVGEHDAAITLSEESLSLFAELDDTWGRAWALNNLGYVAARRGANERAVLLLEEGLALRRAVGDTDEIAWSLRDLGLAVGQQGDYERATALLEESLRLSRELGIKPGISISLNLLGEVARIQGQLDRAAALYEESLALDRDLGARHHQAIAHSNLGYVRLRQGDHARAGTHFVHSLTWFHSVRNPVGTAVCFPGLAGVIAAQGAPERAARLLGAIETLREAAAPYLVTTDIADYERIVRDVQARLDEAAFAAAWAEGRAMTLEQAIADALTVASHARPCE